MKKVFISVLLVTIFLTMTFKFGSFAVEYVTITPLSENLSSELEVVADNDIIEVEIWQDDIDWDAVKEETFKLTGLTDETITDDLGIETIQNYISTKRQIAIKKYKELNDKNKITFEKYDSSNIEYQSILSPMSIVSMTKADVLDFALNDNIESIDTYNDLLIKPCSTVASYNSGATYIQGNGINATGAGVNIGMVENGIPDVDKTYSGYNYFDQTDMHLIGSNTTETDHATLVASIMVGQAIGTLYKGIAPDADLYYAYGSTIIDMYQQIENLVASDVNIINTSYTFYESGTYSNYDMWVDHLAYQHDVHFVTSAGGTYTSIYSPGMAYNAITVGAFNDNNNLYTSSLPSYLSQQYLNSSYYSIASYSSYQEGYNNLAYKPDLVASGTNISFAALQNSGTSFAAPQVAATIAQLCQLYPSLLTNNSGVKAILCAGAVYRLTGDTLESGAPNIFEKQGAGVYSARAARNIMYASKIHNFTMSTQTYSFTINVPNDYNYLRIAMCWIKKNYISGSHTVDPTILSPDLANLKLELLDPNGNVIATSDCSNNNMEIIQVALEASDDGGTYTIRVTNNSYYDGLGNQYVSIACY